LYGYLIHRNLKKKWLFNDALVIAEFKYFRHKLRH